MKIFCIGTTSYKDAMRRYAFDMGAEGHDVRVPKFDDHHLDELRICKQNVAGIEWADEVHIFWDQRSLGTVFDFGAAFALKKPIKIVFMNPKTFANVMRWYENPQLYIEETQHRTEGPGDEVPF